MQIAGLIVYFLSIIAFFAAMQVNYRKQHLDVFYFALPIIFVLAQSLYVLPLAFRGAFEIDFNSQISPLYYEFSSHVPYAVMLTAVFNLIFTFFYVALPVRSENIFGKKRKPVPMGALVFLLVICLLMIYKVAMGYGGLISYILLGYKVVETFAGATEYVVAFNWLIVVAIVYLYIGYLSKDRKKIINGLFAIGVLILVFAIMGRRGVLVVLCAAAVGGYHLLVKKVPFGLLLVGVFLSFFALSFIGLTRGESYSSVEQIGQIIGERGRAASSLGISIFYTLIDGNFAVPFETFPQVIKNLRGDIGIGFGEYSLRALLFFIPNALWENRPLPLSNWYVAEFYGEDQLHVGRQFFILTAPYMDGGVFGVIIFGFLMAVLLRWIARFAQRGRDDPVVMAGVILFMASMLNLISNDLLGFSVAFFKTFILPLIFLHLCRKIRVSK